MKSKFLLVISAILFILSCNQFVNLGDKSSDSADNTEGLPDELYENDSADPGSEGDYSDWNEDRVDTEYYDDKQSDDNSYEDMDDADISDNNCDNESEQMDYDPEPSEIPDTSAYIFPESDPFPEGFSNDECGCGEDPQYDPICCNGVISVFNLCFAHCYAIYSGNKICSVYHTGLCDGYENNDDDEDEIPENDPEESDLEENDLDSEIVEENDNDEELPDLDEDDLESGCGCYPEEEAAIFRCGEYSYLITSCLANCLCEDPEKILF